MMKINSNNSVFLEIFGDSPRMKVMDFLLENHIFDYSKRQIAEFSRISYNTLETFWDQMLVLELLKETRKVGKSRMYILNIENLIIKKLFQIIKDAITQDIDNRSTHHKKRILIPVK